MLIVISIFNTMHTDRVARRSMADNHNENE